MAIYVTALLNNPSGSLFIHPSTDPNAETEFNALAKIGKLSGAYSLPSALVLGLGLITSSYNLDLDQETTEDLEIPVLRGMKVEAVLIKADVTGDATIDVLVDDVSIVDGGEPVAVADNAGVWQAIDLDAALVDIEGPDTPGTFDKTLSVQIVTDTGGTLVNCTVYVLYRLK